MQIAPTSNFVSIAQAILYRGAGFEIIGMAGFNGQYCDRHGVFFVALVRFRKSLTAVE